MAKRYIGNAVITIQYRDDGSYAGTIRAGSHTWKFDELRPPASGFDFGYDSPEAYDEMAGSAVSFGSYYSSHNRGDDAPEWAPDPETADAIEEAVAWAQNDSGEYEVRRSAKREARTNESHHVADFNSLDDLIAHAHRELGATHVSGDGANTKIFFPRGGQYPYEEAMVWRKGSYWHAQGRGSRTGVKNLPNGAWAIQNRPRRAAESRATETTFKKGDRVMWSDSFLRKGQEINPRWYDLRKNERGTVDHIQRDGDVLVKWDGDWDTNVHPPGRLAHATDRALEARESSKRLRAAEPRRLSRSTVRPGMHVRVVNGDSMYRGEVGTIVEPTVDRLAHLDGFNRRFLRGEGTVLVERRNGSLFVIHARDLERENENPIDRRKRLSERHAVRDYIAVDRRGRTIAGPFRSYSDAKSAAGPAGVVQYVRREGG